MGSLSASILTWGASVFFFRDYRAYLNDAKNGGEIEAGILQEKEGRVNQATYASLGALGGAALFGAAAGVIALFVDWHGYGDAAAEAE